MLLESLRSLVVGITRQVHGAWRWTLIGDCHAWNNQLKKFQNFMLRDYCIL